MALDNVLVYIRRQWNGEQVSAVPFDQLHNLYWDDISGERMERAPRPFIHGHVWWSDAQNQIAHVHAHEEGTRWIKVCVVRKDNKLRTFKRLLELVGPRPKWKLGDHWP
jgi:hypothetical protein